MGIWAVLDDTGGALGPLLVGVLVQAASACFAASAISAAAAASTVFFWAAVPETNADRQATALLQLSMLSIELIVPKVRI